MCTIIVPFTKPTVKRKDNVSNKRFIPNICIIIRFSPVFEKYFYLILTCFLKYKIKPEKFPDLIKSENEP